MESGSRSGDLSPSRAHSLLRYRFLLDGRVSVSSCLHFNLWSLYLPLFDFLHKVVRESMNLLVSSTPSLELISSIL